MIALAVFYFIGCLLAYWMLCVDHASEKETFTYGARAIAFALSIFSWLVISYALIAAWIGKIKNTGYWNRPINKTADRE